MRADGGAELLRARVVQLRAALEAMPEVRQVTVGLRTGSVLVLHDGTAAALGERLEDAGCFAIDTAREEAGGTVNQRLHAAGRMLDGHLRRESRGLLDLSSLATLALAGAGVAQVAKGTVLPAGVTLLWNAIGMVRGSTPAPNASAQDEPTGDPHEQSRDQG
jgi:hypothetical protein